MYEKLVIDQSFSDTHVNTQHHIIVQGRVQGHTHTHTHVHARTHAHTHTHTQERLMKPSKLPLLTINNLLVNMSPWFWAG